MRPFCTGLTIEREASDVVEIRLATMKLRPPSRRSKHRCWHMEPETTNHARTVMYRNGGPDLQLPSSRERGAATARASATPTKCWSTAPARTMQAHAANRSAVMVLLCCLAFVLDLWAAAAEPRRLCRGDTPDRIAVAASTILTGPLLSRDHEIRL